MSGKRILVTGAGKGVGREVSIALAKAGCKVYALSRTQSTLDSRVQEYPDIIPITQDLNNWEETRAKLQQIEPLDGLVNNAAVCSLMSCLEETEHQLEHYMRNNTFSAINCTQVVAKKMIEAGKEGSIINITSIADKQAFPLLMGYSISKAALAQATRSFALELGKYNIRVNTVAIAGIMTEMSRKAEEDSGIRMFEVVRERIPMGRLLSLEDTVGPILYLLSDASAMVTGTDHTVDGGLFCNITTKQ